MRTSYGISLRGIAGIFCWVVCFFLSGPPTKNTPFKVRANTTAAQSQKQCAFEQTDLWQFSLAFIRYMIIGHRTSARWLLSLVAVLHRDRQATDCVALRVARELYLVSHLPTVLSKRSGVEEQQCRDVCFAAWDPPPFHSFSFSTHVPVPNSNLGLASATYNPVLFL